MGQGEIFALEERKEKGEALLTGGVIDLLTYHLGSY